MPVEFDSVDELSAYEWETISQEEWSNCYEDLVGTLKAPFPFQNSSDPSPSSALISATGTAPLFTGNQLLSTDQKQRKMIQLVLLQEVWARNGTDTLSFYKSLSLLQQMGILDLKGILPNSNSDSNHLYELVEMVINKLPSNLPLVLNSQSPLSCILDVYRNTNPANRNETQSRPKSAQAEQLMALLKQSRFLNDFFPLGFLGKGGFGTVIKASHKVDTNIYAIKLIRFRDFAVPSKRFQKVFREVTTLARLDHVNIARYYSAWLELTEEYSSLLAGLQSHSKPHQTNHLHIPTFDDQDGELESSENGSSCVSPKILKKSHAEGDAEPAFHFRSDHSSDDDGDEVVEESFYLGDDLCANIESSMSSLSSVLSEDFSQGLSDGDDMHEWSSQSNNPLSDDDDDDSELLDPSNTRCTFEKFTVSGNGTVEVGFKTLPKRFVDSGAKIRSASQPSTRKLSMSTSHAGFPTVTRTLSRRRLSATRQSTYRMFPTSVLLSPSRESPQSPRSVEPPCCSTGKLSICSTSTSNQIQIHAQKFDYTLFIQMQLYSETSLKTWLRREGRSIDFEKNLHIFKQIVAGLQHVHKNGVLHRDLKPANIFMSEDGMVKIGDFGLSKDIRDGFSASEKNSLKHAQFQEDWEDSSHTGSIGTPGYVAPEIINSSVYGPKVDIYSLGIILLELFTLTLTKHERARNLMMIRDRTVPESISSSYPEIARLILDTTHPKPSCRPEIDEISERLEMLSEDKETLKKRVNQQETIILEQNKLIEKLQAENKRLRTRLLRGQTVKFNLNKTKSKT